MLAAFGDEHLLFLATVVYLAVFFSPGDIGYKFVKMVPIYSAVCTIKEVYRALKISKGLKEGSTFKPESVFVPILVATIKASEFQITFYKVQGNNVVKY